MDDTADHWSKLKRFAAFDLVVLCSLLGWSAIPLIFLRGSPVLAGWPWRTGFVLGTAVLVAIWQKFGRLQHAPPIPGPVPYPLWKRGVIVLLLSALTLLCFTVPLTMHFWGGVDDFQVLTSDLWSPQFDAGLNRPLNTTFLWLGLQLTPDRVEGQLLVASLLCFANGLLVMAILRELLPHDRILPLAAAVLMILNRGDMSRFMIMWTTLLYLGPLFFFLLAAWLWLISSRRRSRVLLFFACFFLGAALLGTEGLFPLAAVASLLVWRYWQDRRHGLVWLAAWVGTVGLLAFRFIKFLLDSGSNSYQARMVKGSQGEIHVLHSLKLHLTAVSEYLHAGQDAWKFWAVGLTTLVLVLVVLWLSRGPSSEASSSQRKTILAVAVGGAGAMVLGFLPFLHLQHLFRTHFLASAGEAVMFAALVCLLGSLLASRWRWLGTAVLVALAAGLACIAAFESQTTARRAAKVTFEKSAYIFRQVHTLSPELAPGSALLFILDDGIPSPFGVNYHTPNLTNLLLGVPSFIINGNDADNTGRIENGGLVSTMPEIFGTSRYGFDQVVAFRVSFDGTTQFISELPAALVAAAPEAGKRYRPLERLRPGTISEVRLLRSPLWSDGMPDLFDSTPGVVLGENWEQRRVSQNNKLYREFRDGAEIWINPDGRSKVQVPLNIKPGSDKGDLNLEIDLAIRNEQGADVFRKRLSKDGRVFLELPLQHGRLQRFRFHFVSSGTATPPPRQWKAYRPGTVNKDVLGRRHLDIAGPGTVLAENWHPLERHDGRSFRGVTNDAQIKVGLWSLPVNRLDLAVEPGPSVEKAGVSVELRNQNGEVLGSARVMEFTELSFNLPKAAPPGETFHLHLKDGPSHSVEKKTAYRLRVFRCALEPKDRP